MKSIDFYYDFGSPTAYLAWTQLNILDKSAYKINYFPVLLGGIFKATDNKAPGLVKSKALWMFQDIKMYAEKYNVDFVMNTAFPVNTLYLMRGAIYAERNGNLENYNNAFFNAMWNQNINLNEANEIIKVLESNGFDSKKYLSAVEDNNIKDMLKKNTSDAVDLGIFGVPSFIVDDTLYFGQDRIHWFLN